MSHRKATLSMADSIPFTDSGLLYRDTIQGRAKMSGNSGSLSMDKQVRRDDSMYKQNMLKKNIELENQREERLKQVEDRKKNRHKYRKAFSQLQRQLRRGKGNLESYSRDS